jgi:ribose-phosphate pyrophosphokinase
LQVKRPESRRNVVARKGHLNVRFFDVSSDIGSVVAETFVENVYERKGSSMNRGEIKVFGGTKGSKLAADICTLLRIPVGQRNLGRFGDREVELEITENVRGHDVYVVNPTSAPAEDIIETILLARTAVMSSAEKVTLVIPYLGYNRQERKDRSRVPISAKIVIEMLKTSRANRVLLLDLHSGATAAHFEPEMVHDHLYSSKVLIPYLRTLLTGSYVVASPDAGGATRARKYAEHLGNEGAYVIFDKKRKKPGVIQNGSIKIIGSVRNKNVVFVDDMIDTGGTLIADAIVAKEKGALDIYAVVTHGIFSKGTGVFPKGLFKEIIVTDSVCPDEVLQSPNVKITTCTVAPLLADAIMALNQNKSLGNLFL